MGFSDALKTCFTKYADFSGRALRSEFWWWYLFTFISGFVLTSLDIAVFDLAWDEIGPLSALFSLVTFVPTLAVTARRLHDGDRSGWWQIWPAPAFIVVLLGVAISDGFGGLLALVAGLFFFVFLYWLIVKGTNGDNRFGPNPLAQGE
jgi:uncharacterized membrane protein YhaH (DUF805 family)